MGCRNFFDLNSGNLTKCKELQKESGTTLVDWETQSASEFSPGAVGDDEFLYQQIVDPNHIDPTERKLKPTAFQDSANKGMSTNRESHISWEALVDRGRLRAAEYNRANPERPPRALWGFARFQTAAIRRIVAGEGVVRHYFVYDTANEDDPSHADVCQGVAGNKLVERSIRAALFDLAKDSLIQLDADTQLNDELMTASLREAA